MTSPQEPTSKHILPTLVTIREMETSFRRNNLQDRFGGEALFIFGKWLPWIPGPIITNVCPPKRFQISLHQKLSPIPHGISSRINVTSGLNQDLSSLYEHSTANLKQCGKNRSLKTIFFQRVIVFNAYKRLSSTAQIRLFESFLITGDNSFSLWTFSSADKNLKPLTSPKQFSIPQRQLKTPAISYSVVV